MKYLNSYKIFESSEVYAESFNQKQFYHILYDSETHRLKDPTVSDRIRYMDWSGDFGYYSEKTKPFFTVLFKGDKIIGLCKIAYYSNDYGLSEDEYRSISYCSIDKNYRGKGYLKILIEALMRLCKMKNFVLGTSSWTVPGFLKLRPTVKKYAKKHGVEFIDHINMFDHQSVYTKDLLHQQEIEGHIDPKDEFKMPVKENINEYLSENKFQYLPLMYRRSILMRSWEVNEEIEWSLNEVNWDSKEDIEKISKDYMKVYPNRKFKYGQVPTDLIVKRIIESPEFKGVNNKEELIKYYGSIDEETYSSWSWPILVDDNEESYIEDGWHRFNKYLKGGLDKIHIVKYVY